jgi:hypothetical protein
VGLEKGGPHSSKLLKPVSHKYDLLYDKLQRF